MAPTDKRRVNYFLLCENFIYDDSKLATIVNVFDTVNSSTIPVTARKFTVAFSVRLASSDVKDGKVTFKLEVVGPDNHSMFQATGGGPVENPESAAVSALDLSGVIKFRKAGSHTAKLYIHDQLVAETPFMVNKVKEPKNG